MTNVRSDFESPEEGNGGKSEFVSEGAQQQVELKPTPGTSEVRLLAQDPNKLVVRSYYSKITRGSPGSADKQNAGATQAGPALLPLPALPGPARTAWNLPGPGCWRAHEAPPLPGARRARRRSLPRL